MGEQNYVGYYIASGARGKQSLSFVPKNVYRSLTWPSVPPAENRSIWMGIYARFAVFALCFGCCAWTSTSRLLQAGSSRLQAYRIIAIRGPSHLRKPVSHVDSYIHNAPQRRGFRIVT